MHGHSYKLEVEVSGEREVQGPKKGMVIDFGELKRVVDKAVLQLVDHTVLNDLNSFPFTPTAENLVEFFWWRVVAVIERFTDAEVTLERLRLWETSECWVERKKR
jgi:6-pyruvoyltetrahydropterin/6-carboxytetrahydropterin synthase